MNMMNLDKGYIDLHLDDRLVRKGGNRIRRGFAQMLKHGAIFDVTNPEQAAVAEDAGAVAVMVLDKLPADIRSAGGVARMASVEAIEAVMDQISIPVMAKCRIGHTEEALLLQEVGIDMIDESEVLTPANDASHVWKWDFVTPFVNGCRDLGEALRRIEEGAAMIRTKGEAGTGNVAEAIKHMRMVNLGIRQVVANKDDPQELMILARQMRVSYDIVLEVARLGRLPVVNFAAGGIATPADAAMMMRMGSDGVFVGSGIYKSLDPEQRAQAIVHAVANWDKPDKVLEAQEMIDEKKSMLGIDVHTLKEEDKLQIRGANL